MTECGLSEEQLDALAEVFGQAVLEQIIAEAERAEQAAQEVEEAPAPEAREARVAS